MYKVKNFNYNSGKTLQEELKTWIESRNHISIVSVNTWSVEQLQDVFHYATVVYKETQYNL